MRPIRPLAACVILAGALAPAPAVAGAPEWVAKSDRNSQVLLQVMARFVPEQAGQMGVDGLDDKVMDLGYGVAARTTQALREAVRDLRFRLEKEPDATVRQDLQILIQAAEDNAAANELNDKAFLPYVNVPQTVFSGIRSLLDDQVPEARRKAALVRLRRYAGMESGFRPLAEQARARIEERLNDKRLQGPYQGELEQDLARSAFFVRGLEALFPKYGIKDYEVPLARLKAQFAEYESFLRKEVLPRARKDFRLPPQVYAMNLRQLGVTTPPAELAAQAHAAFDEVRAQMQALAPEVAKAKGLQASDYKSVIRALKQEQLVGDAILAHYQARLKDLEGIVQREGLVSLPARPARIRLASEAESANQPAPSMRPPRLVGNTGEQGEFVLPLKNPNAGDKTYDDFTFAAASWTLTAHEARPGHELQFASMLEKGVSSARAVFAFNSANVEGWGLYAESIAEPYMPAEGRLICLQHRLLRAARAFLDPELQAGKVTPDQARAFLQDEVVLSEAMAKQEVDRYTFMAPGQATAYFFGYAQLRSLRKDTERSLGSGFQAKAFHDFLLAQGLLPPDLLRKAVQEDFVPTVHRAAAAASAASAAR